MLCGMPSVCTRGHLQSQVRPSGQGYVRPCNPSNQPGASTVNRVFPMPEPGTCGHPYYRIHHLVPTAAVLGICLVLLSLAFPAAAAEENRQDRARVVFLPFQVRLPGQYDYLQEGLANMLASRVTAHAGIIALHQSARTRQMSAYLQAGKEQEFARMLGRIRADYVIMGSLTGDKGAYQLTTHVFARSAATTPRRFTRTIQSLDGVMAGIDELAWDIAVEVFGRQRPGPARAAGTKKEGINAFTTEHPERAFREGLYRGGELGLDTKSGFALVTTRRSRKIPIGLKAMDVGDIDGDTTPEIVLATNTELLVYRYADDYFQKVTSLPLASYLRVHAINLADLDGDSRKEIYISANNGARPASLVAAWKDNGLSLLRGDIPFYLRPEQVAGRRPILLGQAGAPGGQPVSPTIYRLIRKPDGSYDKGEPLPLPSGLNLFDFTRADIDGDSTLEIVAIDRKNHLRVMDRAGKVLWQSGSTYGAGKNFFGTLSSTDKGGHRRIYIPTRIIARDLNGDGRADIVVGRNRLATIKFFKRLRYFEGSSIAALSWNGSALEPLWETRKISGYTADYQLVTNTGKKDPATLQLYFAETESSYPFVFWEAESCNIHVYEIRRKKENR